MEQRHLPLLRLSYGSGHCLHGMRRMLVRIRAHQEVGAREEGSLEPWRPNAVRVPAPGIDHAEIQRTVSQGSWNSVHRRRIDVRRQRHEHTAPLR